MTHFLISSSVHHLGVTKASHAVSTIRAMTKVSSEKKGLALV